MERVGLALAPARYILDVNLFAQYILDGQISQVDHPPMCLEQPSPKAEFLTDSDIQYEDPESRDAGEKSLDGKTGSYFSCKEITNYTELYALGLHDENLRNRSLKDCMITREQEYGSYGSPTHDCRMATSCSPSFVHDELENNISLSTPDCNDHFFCDSDKEFGSGIDLVSQNWFLPSCLDKIFLS